MLAGLTVLPGIFPPIPQIPAITRHSQQVERPAAVPPHGGAAPNHGSVVRTQSTREPAVAEGVEDEAGEEIPGPSGGASSGRQARRRRKKEKKKSLDPSTAVIDQGGVDAVEEGVALLAVGLMADGENGQSSSAETADASPHAPPPPTLAEVVQSNVSETLQREQPECLVCWHELTPSGSTFLSCNIKTDQGPFHILCGPCWLTLDRPICPYCRAEDVQGLGIGEVVECLLDRAAAE